MVPYGSVMLTVDFWMAIPLRNVSKVKMWQELRYNVFTCRVGRPVNQWEPDEAETRFLPSTFFDHSPSLTKTLTNVQCKWIFLTCNRFQQSPPLPPSHPNNIPGTGETKRRKYYARCHALKWGNGLATGWRSPRWWHLVTTFAFDAHLSRRFCGRRNPNEK